MTATQNFCLLCFKGFEPNSIEDSNPVEGYTKKVFKSCVKHLNNKIKGKSFHWKHAKDQQPFCSSCFDLADKLWQIDEQLAELVKTLDSHIELFSEEILKARVQSSSLSLKCDLSNPNFVNDNDSSNPNDYNQSEDRTGSNDDHHNRSTNNDVAIKDEPTDVEVEYGNDLDNLQFFNSDDCEQDNCQDNEEDIKHEISNYIDRPKRKSAIMALEILSEMKAEADLNFDGEHFDNNAESGSESSEDYKEGCEDFNDDGNELVSDETENDEVIKPKKILKSEIGGTNKSDSAAKGFKCGVCSMTFSQTKDLDDHNAESGHINEKKYKCTVCDKSFYRSIDLKYHRRYHRDDDRSYTCSICNVVLKTYKGYKKHSKLHVGKFFNCDICVINFTSEKLLTRHMNTHSTSELNCNICGKNFKYRLSLKYHLLNHEKRDKAKEKPAKVKGFMCQVCAAVFPTGKELEQHSIQSEHKNEKGYSCSFCEMSYFRRLDLKYHMKKHKNAGKYKCEPCGKSFIKATFLKIHNRIHTGDTFDCTVCEKKFTTKHKYEDHMNFHTGTTPYPCDLCKEAFTSKSSLAKHKLSEHTDRKFYDCETCGMKLTTSKALVYHMYQHTGLKPFKCENEGCTSSFTTTAKLKLHFIRAHSDVEPTFQCDQCEKKFKVREDLIKHRNKHPDKSRPFMCEECGKCYTSRKTLKGHQIKHSGHFFNCKICDNVYYNKQTLENHVKDIHSKEGYHCAQCDITFRKSNDFKIHCLQHQGERFFFCDVCNKKFTRSKNLSVHKRIHQTERQKHDCDECGKAYTSRQSLKKHKRLHVAGLEYVCHTCTSRFTDKAEFKQHIKAHESKDKPFRCQDCGSGFTRMSNLNKHNEKCRKPFEGVDGERISVI